MYSHGNVALYHVYIWRLSYELLVLIQDQNLMGLHPRLGANDVHRDELSRYINIRREMV